MAYPTRSKVAALLVAAALALPGTVFAASDMAPAAEAPVTMPMPMPDKESKEAPRLAEIKVSREQAIARVHALFPIPAGMNEPNASLSQYKNSAVWRLEWTSPSKQADRRSISASVDAVTGAIIGYSTGGSAPESAELSYSRGEALKLAAEWLDKLAPERKASLRYMEDPLQYGFYYGGMSFSFHWDRVEHGYPVSNEGIDIAIDARTGELATYAQTWLSEVTYTLPETLLAKDKAEAMYRESLPLQLLYTYFRKPGTEKGEWRLVYRPYVGFPFINQDGKLTGWDGEEVDMARLTDLKLLPGTPKPYVKPQKPLDRDAALEVARAVTGRTDEPTSLDCHEYGEETKFRGCYISWESTDGKGGGTSVQVDLTTGLVAHYSNWRNWEPMNEKQEPKVSEQQARETAIKFILKHRPDLAGNALIGPAMDRKHQPMETIRSYSILFQHMTNSVVVSNWNSHVEVDAMTGDVLYFWSNTNLEGENEPFPAVEGLIKQTVAMDGYLANKGLELTWVTFSPMYGKPYPMMEMADEKATKPETRLVWAPKRILPVEFMNAKTGALYDYSGRDLIEAAKRPTDIEGHAAQREIELLWARGIFELKDGKFNPDQTASAADLARWLVLAKGMQPYYEYDYMRAFGGAKAATAVNLAGSDSAQYIGAALQAGILLPEDFGEDYDPATPVSRETFALWAVRALGHGDIAKMENRIDMPFADQATIGAKFQNAVALLHGLKIVRGDAATAFAPQREITRAEAAKILFSVASRGRSLPYYR